MSVSFFFITRHPERIHSDIPISDAPRTRTSRETEQQHQPSIPLANARRNHASHQAMAEELS